MGKGLFVSTESLTVGLAVGLTLMSGVAIASSLYAFNNWWTARWSARYVWMMMMMMMRMMMIGVILLGYTYIIVLSKLFY